MGCRNNASIIPVWKWSCLKRKFVTKCMIKLLLLTYRYRSRGNNCQYIPIIIIYVIEKIDHFCTFWIVIYRTNNEALNFKNCFQIMFKHRKINQVCDHYSVVVVLDTFLLSSCFLMKYLPIIQHAISFQCYFFVWRWYVSTWLVFIDISIFYAILGWRWPPSFWGRHDWIPSADGSNAFFRFARCRGRTILPRLTIAYTVASTKATSR